LRTCGTWDRSSGLLLAAGLGDSCRQLPSSHSSPCLWSGHGRQLGAPNPAPCVVRGCTGAPGSWVRACRGLSRTSWERAGCCCSLLGWLRRLKGPRAGTRPLHASRSPSTEETTGWMKTRSRTPPCWLSGGRPPCWSPAMTFDTATANTTTATLRVRCRLAAAAPPLHQHPECILGTHPAGLHACCCQMCRDAPAPAHHEGQPRGSVRRPELCKPAFAGDVLRHADRPGPPRDGGPLPFR
jgi:hypothetical protein